MSDKNDGGQAFPSKKFELIVPTRLIKMYPELEEELKHMETKCEGMTLRQYAAIKLCIPNSGCDWLDEMIRKSLKDRFAGQALVGLAAGMSQERVQQILEDGRCGANEACVAFGLAGKMLTIRDRK